METTYTVFDQDDLARHRKGVTFDGLLDAIFKTNSTDWKLRLEKDGITWRLYTWTPKDHSDYGNWRGMGAASKAREYKDAVAEITNLVLFYGWAQWLGALPDGEFAELLEREMAQC